MVYKNWANGQPNSVDAEREQENMEEDGVVIISDGVTAFWHDFPTENHFEFVCLYTEYIVKPGKIHGKRLTMNKMLLIKDLFGSKYHYKFNRGIDVFPGTSVMV